MRLRSLFSLERLPQGAPAFTVVRRLGRGGMGEVELALMRTGSGTEWVALKRIRPELVDRPEVSQHFAREARLGAMLQHDHIVSVRAHGADSSGLYLALEFVD